MTDHVLWNPFTYLYPAIVLVSGIRWYRSKRRQPLTGERRVGSSGERQP